MGGPRQRKRLGHQNHRVHVGRHEHRISGGQQWRGVDHHEIESLESALAWAEPGDVVVMIALERSAELYDRLERLV